MEALCCCGQRRRARTDGSVTNASFLPFRSSRDDAFARNNVSQAHSGTISEQISPSESPIELCRVAREEPDLAPTSNLTSNSRSSTFEGMKAKLIKHISNDSGVRRQSRVSIGHSDIELARRAEVRRLQQRRIQDELEKDNPCDDCSDNTNHSARYLSPLIDIGNPRVGPRDAIEFSVESVQSIPVPKASPQKPPASECLGPEETSEAISLVESSHASGESGHSDEVQDASLARVVSRVNSQSLASDSIRCISPLATKISPRNSYQGAPIVDRIIGKENEFNIRHGSHAWDDQSALGIWLLAQGIKFQDNSIMDTNVVEENSQPANGNCRAANDLGAVDRVTDSPTAHDESLPSHPGDDGAGNTHSEPHSHDKMCPDIGSMNEILAAVNHVEDGPVNTCRQHHSANNSSNYPSVMPSFRPSPEGSDSNGYILSQGDLKNLEFSPFQWYGTLPVLPDLGQSEGKSSYATADEFTSRTAPRLDTFIGPRSSHGSVFCNRAGTISLASSDSSSFNTRRPHPGGVSSNIPAVPSSTTVQFGETDDARSKPTAKRYRQSLKAKIQHSLSNIPRIHSSSVGSRTSIVTSPEKGKSILFDGVRDVDRDDAHSASRPRLWSDNYQDTPSNQKAGRGVSE